MLADVPSRFVSMCSAQKQLRQGRRESIDVLLAQPIEHEEIRDDEFSGADRYRRGRSGEACFSGFDSSVVASAAPSSRLPEANEPSLSDGQSGGSLRRKAKLNPQVWLFDNCSKFLSREESISIRGEVGLPAAIGERRTATPKQFLEQES